MGNFYKNHQNLSKNERILGTDEAQTETKKEQGRSMVEMLGVLAVVGVLSVGAISGYRYAMNKYRANQTVNELNLLSHQVAIAMMSKNGLSGTLKLGEPYDTNKKLTSSGYDIAFGCGESGNETPCQNQNKFHFEVNGVSEGVCKELVQMTEHLQDLTFRTDTCATGTTDFQIIFDIPDAAGGGSGAGEAGPKSNPKNCSGLGFYEYGRCNCYAGYSGAVCEQTDTTCSGHGTWNDGSCTCDAAYVGDNCAFLREPDCHGRGTPEGRGQCVSCQNSYGWFCELDEDPCQNGGSWSSLNGCSCPSGFAGEYCESKESEFCKNGGRWGYNYHNGYYNSCICPDGYSGYDCSIKIYMSDFDDYSDYRD